MKSITSSTTNIGNGTNNRNQCWRNARERKRMKARYAIRERILFPLSTDTTTTTPAPATVATTTPAPATIATTTTSSVGVVHQQLSSSSQQPSVVQQEEKEESISSSSSIVKEKSIIVVTTIPDNNNNNNHLILQNEKKEEHFDEKNNKETATITKRTSVIPLFVQIDDDAAPSKKNTNVQKQTVSINNNNYKMDQDNDENLNNDDDDDDNIVQINRSVQRLMLFSSSGVVGSEKVKTIPNQPKTINEHHNHHQNHVQIKQKQLQLKEQEQYELFLRCTIQKMLDGNKSYFSLQRMEQYYTYFNKSFPTNYLFEKKNEIPTDDNDMNATDTTTTTTSTTLLLLLVGESKLVAWYGFDQVRVLKHYLLYQIHTITLYECTILFRRYTITGLLLLGGINPCISGQQQQQRIVLWEEKNNTPSTKNRNSSNKSHDAHHSESKEIKNSTSTNSMENNDSGVLVTNEEQQDNNHNHKNKEVLLIHQLGQKVLQQLYCHSIPVTLSSYIMKRIVEMRITFITTTTTNKYSKPIVQQNNPSSSLMMNPVCGRQPRTIICCTLCHQASSLNHLTITTPMLQYTPSIPASSLSLIKKLLMNDACDNIDEMSSNHSHNHQCNTNTTSKNQHHNTNDPDHHHKKAKDGGSCCHHIFCEVCYWNFIIQRMKNVSHYDDVVVCPICSTTNTTGHHPLEQSHHTELTTTSTIVVDSNDDDNNHCVKNNSFTENKVRAMESLQKFFMLPTDSSSFVQMKQKKKKPMETDSLSNSWSQAVQNLIGTTQVLRCDKFFTFLITKNNNDNDHDTSNLTEMSTSFTPLYHYIRGCLDNGVDVNHQNEYGQTGLYLASWYGYRNIVQLLLEYGADSNILAHGNLSCIDAAKANGHIQIVSILQAYEVLPSKIYEEEENGTCQQSTICVTKKQLRLSCKRCTMLDNCHSTPPPLLEEVIGWDRNHPGAGSFVLDNIIPSEVINALIELWKSVPLASEDMTKQSKGKLCSVRSYFCDVEGWVTKHIETVLVGMINRMKSHPAQKQSGTVLDDCDHSATISDSIEDGQNNIIVFPHMRFLCYSQSGSVLPPHVDLCKLHPFSGQRSTHSFLLYLTDCRSGGETALLEGLHGMERYNPLSIIQPKRGRLLLFPHLCPHEGIVVEDVPKLLVRGEIHLPRKAMCNHV